MMTPSHLRAALARLSLSHGTAASLFDVEDRTVRRWLKEGAPDSVAFTLMLMARFSISPQRLCAMMVQEGYDNDEGADYGDQGAGGERPRAHQMD